MNREKGVTLVELLATITIMSLILIFIVSIQIIIQKQYKTQTESTEQLTDITIAVKSITRDLRSGKVVSVDENHSKITIGDITYELNGDILQKNGNNYVYSISQFYVDKIGDKVTLIVESKSGKILETEIVLREGDTDEA